MSECLIEGFTDEINGLRERGREMDRVGREGLLLQESLMQTPSGWSGLEALQRTVGVDEVVQLNDIHRRPQARAVH